MRNLILIIAREYLVRVRTRAFLVFTILMPLLVGGLVVLPGMLVMKDPSKRRVAIVGSDARLAVAVRDELAASPGANEQKDPKPDESAKTAEPERPEQPEIDIHLEGAPSETLHQRLTGQLSRGLLDGVLWIDSDVLATRRATYYARNASDFVTVSAVRRALRAALGQRQLAAYGLTPEKAKIVLGPVALDSVRVDDDGSNRSNGLGAF